VKFELGQWMQQNLANFCAETIAGEITNRHLKRTGTSYGPYLGNENFREVCAMFRALEPGYPRRELRSCVKYLLHYKISTEHATPVNRWQDYVRAVAANYGQPCPGANTDPAWATFILRIPEAKAA
jgi:hypothetical protein